MSIWVDDFTVYCPNRLAIDEFYDKLEAKYKIKKIGLQTLYLGMEITHRPDGVLHTQTKYIDDMLMLFGMSDCKAESTPKR